MNTPIERFEPNYETCEMGIYPGGDYVKFTANERLKKALDQAIKLGGISNDGDEFFRMGLFAEDGDEYPELAAYLRENTK